MIIKEYKTTQHPLYMSVGSRVSIRIICSEDIRLKFWERNTENEPSILLYHNEVR